MELYDPRRTVLHSLHPGSKILSFILLSIGPIVLRRPEQLAAALSAATVLSAASGAARNIRKALPLLVWFFILTVVLWAVLLPAPEEGGGGSLTHPSRAAWIHGLSMGLRLVTLTFLGLTFLTITSVEEFSQGCQSLGVGYRASFALSLSFRLVPLFFDTVQAVVLAQKSRGFDIGRLGLLARVRGFFPLFVPIISHALRDADGLALALECRGFGSGPRSTIDPRSWEARDVFAVGLAGAIVVLSVTLRLWGGGGSE